MPDFSAAMRIAKPVATLGTGRDSHIDFNKCEGGQSVSRNPVQKKIAPMFHVEHSKRARREGSGAQTMRRNLLRSAGQSEGVGHLKPPAYGSLLLFHVEHWKTLCPVLG